MDQEREPLAGGEEPLSDGFDDVELGPAGRQRAEGPTEPSAEQISPSSRQQRVALPGAASGVGGACAGADPCFLITTSPQFIDYLPLQQPLPQQQQQQQQQQQGKHSSRPGSRPASFSLVAASGKGASTPALQPMPQQPESPPVSTGAVGLLAAGNDQWQAAAEVDAEGVGAPARKSPLDLITAPVQVPVCSVIFSLVCGILALVFFLLFLAHHDRWEESGCTLLLTAASAAAGPGSLMLRSVHDPATLVCLGREEHAPQVTEDALASLLAAHPKAFSEAQAQLSFTPAGSAQRWGISLEVKGLALNATAGTATIQVEDWEAASAADAGTFYPGTEAFARQFGEGAPLGQPLLVLRLDDEGLVVGLGD